MQEGVLADTMPCRWGRKALSWQGLNRMSHNPLSNIPGRITASAEMLEAAVAEYTAQTKLLSAVVKGPCFKTDELPPVPDPARKPPARPSGKGLFDAEDDDE